MFAITDLDSAIDPLVFSNQGVDGIVVRTTWKDTEAQPGQYDWTFIDAEINRASAKGKMVILIVLPGAYTPAWAEEGAQTATFTSKYGSSAGQTLILPIPWDSTYLGHWYDFVRALGVRYDPNPTVVNVPAVGPTSISAEMSLPDTPEDVTQWISLGYTKDRYEAAWKQTLDIYMQTFPHKKVTLTLYPGLPIPNEAARETVRQDLVDYGVRQYSAQFGIQTSGLSARKQMDPRMGYDLVKSYAGKITTGFTLGTAASVKPQRLGGSDPRTALLDTINFGLEAGVKYLVIYEKDILDPALKSTIQYAHLQLTGQ